MPKPVSPLILNDHDISLAAPSLAEIADIVAETYRVDGAGGAEVPSKIGVHPDHRNSFCHAMPAWVSGQRALGMKWVSYYPGIRSQGFPDSTGIIILNDPDAGLPVAIMEGMWITYARTTACAAVMARALMTTPPRTLGLIGCGGLGSWMVHMAVSALPEIERIVVSSRTEASRERFCEHIAAETDLEIIPASRPQDAVSAADLVVSSIPPPEKPLIEPGWLRPGALYVPLDYFHCYGAQAIKAMEVIITDDCEKVSEQLEKILGGKEKIALHSFRDLMSGRDDFKRAPDRSIMALPTGVASTDMTVGWEIYRRALAKGLGTEVVLTT